MQRFYNKVNKDGPNGCWEWAAYRNHDDYGGFWLDGEMKRAHRTSWMLEHGSIPDGLHVLHHCDNRKCVNPDHLWLGTHADNMRDMAEKGRAASNPQPGETNGRAKLTEADIPAIRADNRFLRVIAAEYGVSPKQISRIKRRERWTHI